MTTIPPKANGANGHTRNGFGGGATFSPGFNINVNKTVPPQGGAAPAAAPAGQGGGSQLPVPEFLSPADVRNYCNSLRSLGVGLHFEVAMAAEILSAVLANVPDPEGRPFGSKLRGRRVARKLHKAAEALKDAATNAAGAYSAFQQEYQEELGRVRHRARPSTGGQRINWTNQ
ncbi:plasmid transfer protein TraA [Kitasatospora sp. NPDC007106]|uniref:plasmid transfer protein TraA n=1 Tax=Kitasatospora sp. NPDC007106 TaxID=3156914 RepID=UPI0033F833EA